MTLKEKRLKALRETRSMWSNIHKDRGGDLYYKDKTGKRNVLGSLLCPLCVLVDKDTLFDNKKCNKCPVMIVFGRSAFKGMPCVPLIKKIKNQRTNAERNKLATKYINKMIRHIKKND